MQPEWLEEAEDWLAIADLDLLSAQRLMDGDPTLTGNATYHAQQAAEKALKAYIVARGRALPRTHALIVLLSECEEEDESFSSLRSQAIALNPYATRFRYPLVGDLLQPEDAEAIEAIEYAAAIVTTTRERIASLPVPTDDA